MTGILVPSQTGTSRIQGVRKIGVAKIASLSRNRERLHAMGSSMSSMPESENYKAQPLANWNHRPSNTKVPAYTHGHRETTASIGRLPLLPDDHGQIHMMGRGNIRPRHNGRNRCQTHIYRMNSTFRNSCTDHDKSKSSIRGRPLPTPHPTSRNTTYPDHGLSSAGQRHSRKIPPTTQSRNQMPRDGGMNQGPANNLTRQLGRTTLK